ECSWGKRGGMSDRSEIYGEGGVTYADLHMGNALPTYSEYGFGYAVEKAPTTQGWSWPVFEEHWKYGISPASCAARKRCRPQAKTAASSCRRSMPAMLRPEPVRKSKCRIRPKPASRSKSGWETS